MTKKERMLQGKLILVNETELVMLCEQASQIIMQFNKIYLKDDNKKHDEQLEEKIQLSYIKSLGSNPPISIKRSGGFFIVFSVKSIFIVNSLIVISYMIDTK